MRGTAPFQWLRATSAFVGGGRQQVRPARSRLRSHDQHSATPARQLRSAASRTANAAFLLGLLVGLAPASAQDAEPTIERGRYLVTITGCNGCHTEGYIEAKGNIPESEWLKGSLVGYRGPWGTSYASNLRVLFPYWSEDGWVKYVRGSFHTLWPPMPWYDMQKMSESDLRSIHKFIFSLGRAGSPTPHVEHPGKDPGGTYILYPGAR